MAPDRKAARQQRLRGAQTREPQDINFAFTLPAPPPRTTRSAVTPSSSRRAIPTRGRGSSSSRRSGSTRKRVEQKTPSDSRAEKRQRIEVAETSAKTPERDIEEDELSSINPVAQLGEEVTESPRNAPGSGRRQHFSSDPAERVTPTKLKTPRDTTRRKSQRVVPSPELDAVEEVDELFPRIREEIDELSPRIRDEVDELSPDQARVRGGIDELSPDQSRVREEIDELSPDQSRIRPEEGELGSGSARRLSRRRLDTTEAAKTPSTNAAKKRRRRTAPDELEAAETPIDATKKRRRRGDHEEPDELEEAGDVPTSTAKKRRRSDHEEPDELEGARDVPTSTAKKRGRQSGRAEAEETPSAAKQAKTRRRRGSALDQVAEAEEAEEISAADAAKKLVSKRRRRSSPAAEQRPPTKPSPAKQRAPKTRKPAGAKRRGAVPVTAYRMTRHDSDSGDDILNRAIPFASRSGVNAVDVLSQACDEFSVSAIEALGRGLEGAETSAERREYRTKLLAVEAFAEEARWKLMELTIAVDGEYAVRKRVRAVVKEKGELRARLMQLRAERERVALQMDAARIQHEEEGKENETLVSLSTTMHDVSLATALGRDTTTDGSLAGPPLPVVIDEVAAMASRKSREGGLLKRLREFNGFLERVAGAVEGR